MPGRSVFASAPILATQMPAARIHWPARIGLSPARVNQATALEQALSQRGASGSGVFAAGFALLLFHFGFQLGALFGLAVGALLALGFDLLLGSE